MARISSANVGECGASSEALGAPGSVQNTWSALIVLPSDNATSTFSVEEKSCQRQTEKACDGDRSELQDNSDASY
eukprot:COSAG03_NODE_10577_length_642_cov_0.948435_2_plen_74_part_01